MAKAVGSGITDNSSFPQDGRKGEEEDRITVEHAAIERKLDDRVLRGE